MAAARLDDNSSAVSATAAAEHRRLAMIPAGSVVKSRNVLDGGFEGPLAVVYFLNGYFVTVKIVVK